MYAIVRTGGKQYRVREGDRIAVERLDAAQGDEVTLEEVLLVGEEGSTTVGAPLVAGASVSARVDEQFRDRKVRIFKYKNKTRQRTHRGHRQQRTRLLITGISAG
jgi:large subunit ribosomal protein L21